VHGGNENGPSELGVSVTLPRTGGNVWVHERQAGQKNRIAQICLQERHGYCGQMGTAFAALCQFSSLLSISGVPLSASPSAR